MDTWWEGKRLRLPHISILNNRNAVFGPRAPICPREINNGS